jgi:arylsulfatase A-like enzyme
MQEGILLALAGFWAAAVSASNVTAKPNILYIMADDMSASIVGVYGQPIGQLNVTPHIDSLAKQGVRMTNLFATNSLCAPSRASIQTGTYYASTALQSTTRRVGLSQALRIFPRRGKFPIPFVI